MNANSENTPKKIEMRGQKIRLTAEMRTIIRLARKPLPERYKNIFKGRMSAMLRWANKRIEENIV